jgi:transposase-like protein/IS1 family transposase
MTCHNCKIKCQKFGKDRKGNQRFRCCQCYKTYSERTEKLDGTYLPTEKITQIVRLLVEGCSVRSIERITGIHRDTILNVLVLVGDRCERLLENKITGLPVSDVECDEIWGYVGCKEKHNRTRNPEFGDAYCFVAIERASKLILAWHLGRRSARDTVEFIDKLDSATAGKYQVTTDGFSPYYDAIHTALGVRVDYAQLIKVFESSADEEHRYLATTSNRGNSEADVGESRRGAYLHVACRETESFNPYGHEAHDAVDKWFQQEVGEPKGSLCGVVCFL